MNGLNISIQINYILIIIICIPQKQNKKMNTESKTQSEWKINT